MKTLQKTAIFAAMCLFQVPLVSAMEKSSMQSVWESFQWSIGLNDLEIFPYGKKESEVWNLRLHSNPMSFLSGAKVDFNLLSLKEKEKISSLTWENLASSLFVGNVGRNSDYRTKNFCEFFEHVFSEESDLLRKKNQSDFLAFLSKRIDFFNKKSNEIIQKIEEHEKKNPKSEEIEQIKKDEKIRIKRNDVLMQILQRMDVIGLEIIHYLNWTKLNKHRNMMLDFKLSITDPQSFSDKHIEQSVQAKQQALSAEWIDRLDNFIIVFQDKSIKSEEKAGLTRKIIDDYCFFMQFQKEQDVYKNIQKMKSIIELLPDDVDAQNWEYLARSLGNYFGELSKIIPSFGGAEYANLLLNVIEDLFMKIDQKNKKTFHPLQLGQARIYAKIACFNPSNLLTEKIKTGIHTLCNIKKGELDFYKLIEICDEMLCASPSFEDKISSIITAQKEVFDQKNRELIANPDEKRKFIEIVKRKTHFIKKMVFQMIPLEGKEDCSQMVRQPQVVAHGQNQEEEKKEEAGKEKSRLVARQSQEIPTARASHKRGRLKQ